MSQAKVDVDAYVIQNGELVHTDKNGNPPQQKVKTKTKPRRSTPWNIGCKPWCRKYFWEGQALMNDEATIEEELSGPTWLDKLMSKYRRPVSTIIPALVFHFVWWCVMIRYNLWHLFQTRYPMSITMVFGSIIAGMTSEGGGAVAFPVMTLALRVDPTVARDFSMFIQACGMSAAAFAIFFMGVQIEWNSLVLCSLGGGLGLILGLEYVDPLLTSSQKKMGFVSLWFSFAFALFLLNRYHKRKTYRTIPYFSFWKALVLTLAGTLGGIFTSFAGSGLDICSFGVLTLLFRVSEKTATPTSVILMGLNSVLGAFWRIVMMADVSTETFEYLTVCVSIVVIGAPLGSVIGSHFHRQVLAALVYILDTVSLISAFILVHQTPLLAGMSVGIIIGGGILFFILTKLGHVLMNRIEKRMEKESIAENKVKSSENGINNQAFNAIEQGDIKIAHL